MKYGIRGYAFYDSDKEALLTDFDSPFYPLKVGAYCCRCGNMDNRSNDKSEPDFDTRLLLNIGIRGHAQRVHSGAETLESAEKLFHEFQGARFKFEAWE